MKRTITKTRNRRVFGISMAFACLALTSTGFSVWIISNSIVETEGKVSIDYVDTAENQTVQLNATIDEEESLTITEKYSDDDYTGGGTCYVTNDSEDETDFEVTISNVSVTAGSSYLASHTITGIEVTMYSWVDGSNNAVVWQPTDTSDDLIGSRTGSDTYTYIELDTDTTKLSFVNDDFTTTGNTGTYTISGAWTVKFKWGSFFNYESPCTYYNTVLNDGSVDPTTQNLDYITQELNTMHDRLDNSTLTISISLVYEDNANAGD